MEESLLPYRLPRRRVIAWAALTPLLCGRAKADLVDVIAAAKPSVVAVGTFNATNSPRFGFRGSGFAVGDGTMVVTNFHVLPGAVEGQAEARLAVFLPGGRDAKPLRSARVLAVDRAHDLALLAIEGAPLPVLPLADPGTAREGMAIALMGFPIGGALGFSTVTHRGIIASITGVAIPAANAQQLNQPTALRLRAGSFDVYQLDATAYPGNSGGPVLDVATGQVVAIINMVLVKGTKESALTYPSGISYAIPVQYVAALLAQPR